MINWIEKSPLGRGNHIDYLAISILVVKTKSTDPIYQIHFRFSPLAQADCNLHLGDKVVLGFDHDNKQICFKKVEKHGYKLCSAKNTSTLNTVITSPFNKKFYAHRYAKENVIWKNDHWAINAANFFDEIKTEQSNG